MDSTVATVVGDGPVLEPASGVAKVWVCCDEEPLVVKPGNTNVVSWCPVVFGGTIRVLEICLSTVALLLLLLVLATLVVLVLVGVLFAPAPVKKVAGRGPTVVAETRLVWFIVLKFDDADDECDFDVVCESAVSFGSLANDVESRSVVGIVALATFVFVPAFVDADETRSVVCADAVVGGGLDTAAFDTVTV